jgi:hypothetical protein
LPCPPERETKEYVFISSCVDVCISRISHIDIYRYLDIYIAKTKAAGNIEIYFSKAAQIVEELLE